MSFSDVIRNIAKTVTNKDELKEKAKDLPLLVVQTTLSAAGQALLLVDRMKNSIKGLGKEEREEEQETRPSAAEQVAAGPAETEPASEQDKPARKEPVIFAPRPEPNGVAKTKPDPVIFAPTKTEPAKPAEPAEPAKPEPTETEPAVAEAAPEKPAATKSSKTSKPKATESKATTEAEPKAAETKTDEAKAAEVKTAETKADEPKAAEPVAAPEPAAATEEPAKAPEPAAAPEPATAAKVDLAEPLPGYSQLTIASLRARMRGKSAEQISAFLEYEKATTARPEVIRMFENRLAKLQAAE
ncbi:hypothetical protein ACFMQL_09000 [Nonomuraea fastidiosa]|jgi:hypothetical protein|uniref:hypothetical protein n=1 Tax=Nonomuraea TaxID=83681 RepID=UPI0032459061